MGNPFLDVELTVQFIHPAAGVDLLNLLSSSLYRPVECLLSDLESVC